MKSYIDWLNEDSNGSWHWFGASSLLVARLRKPPFHNGLADRSIILGFLKDIKADNAWTKDESWKPVEPGQLYARWSRNEWKVQVRKWAKVHDASEWIAYVSSSESHPMVEFWWRKADYVRTAFEGPSGVWSCKVAGIRRHPKEADLLLKIMEIKNDKGWMHAQCPIGRETFSGFMKKWRKENQPKEWIAFARVESLGSIRYIEKRDGLKPSRPDLDQVDLWFRPRQAPAIEGLASRLDEKE